jgi:hypothetical protein
MMYVEVPPQHFVAETGLVYIIMSTISFFTVTLITALISYIIFHIEVEVKEAVESSAGGSKLQQVTRNVRILQKSYRLLLCM